MVGCDKAVSTCTGEAVLGFLGRILLQKGLSWEAVELPLLEPFKGCVDMAVSDMAGDGPS